MRVGHLKRTAGGEAEDIVPTKMQPSIVLCATQRSGSTLVCEDLRNNGLGLAEEWFGQFLGGSVNPNAMIEAVRNRGTDEGGVFSVKLMASYAGSIDAILRGGETTFAAPLWAALANQYSDSLWLYISRRSIVRQAISRLLSEKTGINHGLSRSDGRIKPGRSVVDYRGPDCSLDVSSAQIESRCLDILREQELWERFFKENGIEPLRIEYEEMAPGVSYLETVVARLGLAPRRLNAERALTKLSNEVNDQIFDQFMREPIRRRRSPVTVLDEGPSAQDTIARARGRWVSTPYYRAAEGAALRQWEQLITPFFGDAPIDYRSTLELAVGHGRMSAILLERAGKFVGLDILRENVEICRTRFGENDQRKFVVNDGISLAGVDDGSITFGFCFDSMVHFDMDVIRSYLKEFHRVLAPGGHVFLHHSNYSRNPTGDFARSPHARNFMTKELFQLLAQKAGLAVVRAKIIPWGGGPNRCEDHDCLSLLRRPET